MQVFAWRIEPGQYPLEVEPPKEVPGGQVTILVPYGSLFFAAAPVFNEQLPKVTENSRHAVVILRLRGETNLGSTFLDVLSRYGEALRSQKSLLMLVGVAPSVRRQLERTGMLRSLGHENVFLSDSLVGYGLEEAVDTAEAWIAERSAP
ncbi:STAS domain-containing protein [Leptodesmis sp.]|uniref:STAS domain-containing protein n=1 Tax=Leptodesmis sp. TaxID=3100501 RepID=UPI004053511E